MSSRTEQIFRTRDILDTPLPNKPSFHQLLRQEISTETDIANALNNTGQPWTTNEYQLNYSPNQSEYVLNATDIGRILFVVRLTNNPYVPALPVPFQDLATLRYGTIWTNFYTMYNGIGAYSLPETIEQMAFYRSGVVNPETKVEIQPMPIESATYVITYLIGEFGNNDPLESAIALPEFATMGQLRNAVALLPYTRWSDDYDMDMKRKQELMQAFQYQLNIKEPIFADYKRSLVHSGTVDCEDWNYAS